MLLLSLDFENNLAVVDSTEAVPEDHFPEDMEDTDLTESTTLDQQEEAPSQDVTYSFAVLFALGIIVGLLFFAIFSRRWN